MPLFIFDHATQTVIEVERRPPAKPAFPAIHRDYSAYLSPLTGKMIEGRQARREEMKRENVRELDPSEKPTRAETPDWVKDWRAGRGIQRIKPKNGKPE